MPSTVAPTGARSGTSLHVAIFTRSMSRAPGSVDRMRVSSGSGRIVALSGPGVPAAVARQTRVMAAHRAGDGRRHDRPQPALPRAGARGCGRRRRRGRARTPGTSSRTRSHGVGLIIQGSSCIFPEGRTSPGMTCVDTREKVLRLAPMVDAVHARGRVDLHRSSATAGSTRWRRGTSRTRQPRARPDARRVAGRPWSLRPAFRGRARARDDDRRGPRDGVAATARSRRGPARPATTACSSARPTPSCSTSSSRRSTTGAPTSSAGRPSARARVLRVIRERGRRASAAPTSRAR